MYKLPGCFTSSCVCHHLEWFALVNTPPLVAAHHTVPSTLIASEALHGGVEVEVGACHGGEHGGVVYLAGLH